MKVKDIISVSIVALVFMLITGIAKANPVSNWLLEQKTKTVEYQKKSWEDGKVQLANTKKSIADLFKKVTGNATQD